MWNKAILKKKLKKFIYSNAIFLAVYKLPVLY